MTGQPSMTVTVTVNGRAHTRLVPARLLLSDFLRHELGLTGTHVGCEHGVCGACNVLIDGHLSRSCLFLAAQADGRTVTTIEGIADADGLHPAQQAMLDHRGLQCGFCTPGVVMTLVDLSTRKPDLTDEQLRDELAGNLCRCTGYQGILDAARALLRPPATPNGEETAA